MLKTSLIFAAIALSALLLADLEISTLDPWLEFGRMAKGAVTPDFLAVWGFWHALLNTVVFALCGICLAVVFGVVLAFFFRFTPIRLFCAFVRAIHEIFWGFIFLSIVGLNSVCGVLAIAIPYAGIFAKVYAEIVQESDHRPREGVPTRCGGLSRFVYGILPVIYADAKHYTGYRFECALRSSAILGFIGLPTLGFHLETAFREGLYSEAAALLYVFYLLIASLRYWVKARFIPVYIAAAFVLLSWEITLSWANVARFFTYEILPWPMRREGVSTGSFDVSYAWMPIWQWIRDIIADEGGRGIWNTVILTQIVLVGTGVFTLLIFPFASRHFTGKIPSRISHYLLIILRTTPEYILAFVFVQLWGPSMLPAVWAILLHNGAILAFLTSNNADLVRLRLDAPHKRTDRYFYEILPRVYGQFLAFLFYRWEVMMRESAMLGILGVYTLGFYIDSAIEAVHMDKVVLLIFITALLNMGIDSVSQLVRRGLKISTKLVTSG
ncbi:MAG: ABC transporter permease [Candidatus Poribacteria bacterium]|nr:ABC transporter permease [Candidatus Poribacteria bacterium]MDE0504839.1 ABC transporter permease [Candidatus Poribacteria bacterium]